MLVTVFYYICKLLAQALFLCLSRWDIRGTEAVPRSGPLIIVTNHLSIIDPVLLTASIPRQIVFMAKEELFWPDYLLSPFMRLYGAFPVRRGQPDREALRQAERTLARGLALGMFPEGTRSRSRQIQAGHPGTSLIALRSGAPILPVGLAGTEKVTGVASVLRRPRLLVRVGKPFFLPKPEGKLNASQLDLLTDLVMQRIAELLPEGYRAGCPAAQKTVEVAKALG